MELVLNENEQITRVYNPEKRALNDAQTLLAEMLDGNMRTPIEFSFDGQELFSDDGSPLGPIFEDSLHEAGKLGPNLGFELRRVAHDKDEYGDMIAMAKGEMPNTMVVVRDYPKELWNAKRDLRGYNHKRKQTMLCVISWNNGIMSMHSQSLDQSDRTALEVLYGSMGEQPDAGELYGQRIHADLAPEDQKFLVDKLMRVYDRSMTAQHGGEWHAGRRDQRRINTYDFVCAQNDLVQAFFAEGRDTSLTGRNFYDLVAAMDTRLNKPAELVVPVSSQEKSFFLQGVASNPYIEMRMAGKSAVKEGKSWSGCGVTTSQKDKMSLKAKMRELGFGIGLNPFEDDEDDEEGELPYDFDTLMFCEEHQAPPGEDEDEVWCGPCGYCEPCDTEIRRRNKTAVKV